MVYIVLESILKRVFRGFYNYNNFECRCDEK
jgi:hypothetical protein